MLIKEEDFLFLSSLSKNLKKQRTLENFEPEKVYIFQLYNKFDNVLQFITRASAEDYIKTHPEEFKNIIMNITENKNKDLDRLLKIIERNF